LATCSGRFRTSEFASGSFRPIADIRLWCEVRSMENRPLKHALPILLGAAGLIGGVVGYAIRSSEWIRPVAPRTASNDRIVDKALDIYGHGKLSREGIRRSYDLNVVYLPNMTCVGFNLLPGTAGGDDTMCLDKSGQHVVLTYRDGD